MLIHQKENSIWGSLRKSFAAKGAKKDVVQEATPPQEIAAEPSDEISSVPKDIVETKQEVAQPAPEKTIATPIVIPSKYIPMAAAGNKTQLGKNISNLINNNLLSIKKDFDKTPIAMKLAKIEEVLKKTARLHAQATGESFEEPTTSSFSLGIRFSAKKVDPLGKGGFGAPIFDEDEQGEQGGQDEEAEQDESTPSSTIKKGDPGNYNIGQQLAQLAEFKESIKKFYEDAYELMRQDINKKTAMTWKEMETNLKSIVLNSSLKDVAVRFNSLVKSIFMPYGVNDSDKRKTLKGRYDLVSKNEEDNSFTNVYGDIQTELFGDLVTIDQLGSLNGKNASLIAFEMMFSEDKSVLMNPIRQAISSAFSVVKDSSNEKEVVNGVGIGSYYMLEKIDKSGQPTYSIETPSGEIINIGTRATLESSIETWAGGINALHNSISSKKNQRSNVLSIAIYEGMSNDSLSGMLKTYILSQEFVAKINEFENRTLEENHQVTKNYGKELSDLCNEIINILKWFKGSAMASNMGDPERIDEIASIRFITQPNNDYIAIAFDGRAPILLSGSTLHKNGIITTSNLAEYFAGKDKLNAMETIYKGWLKKLIKEDTKKPSAYARSKFYDELSSGIESAARYRLSIKLAAGTSDFTLIKFQPIVDDPKKNDFLKRVNVAISYKNQIGIICRFNRISPTSFHAEESGIKLTGVIPEDQKAKANELVKKIKDGLRNLSGSYPDDLVLRFSQDFKAMDSSNIKTIRDGLSNFYFKFLSDFVESIVSETPIVQVEPELEPEEIPEVEPDVVVPTPVIEQKAPILKLENSQIIALWREQLSLMSKGNKTPEEASRVKEIGKMLRPYMDIIDTLDMNPNDPVEKILMEAQNEASKNMTRSISKNMEQKLKTVLEAIKANNQKSGIEDEQRQNNLSHISQIEKLINENGSAGTGTPAALTPAMRKQIYENEKLKESFGNSLLIALAYLKDVSSESEKAKYIENAQANLNKNRNLRKYLEWYAKTNKPNAKSVAEFLTLVPPKIKKVGP